MGFTSTKLDDKKNARLQKFPCDGVPRYDVGRGPSNKNLPYGKAYDAIFKQECCEELKDHITYTTGGSRRLLILNEAYCGHARDFLVNNRARQKKELEDWAASIKARKEEYLQREEEISRLLDLRHRDMTTAEDEAHLVQLDAAQEASPFVRDTEGTLIVKPGSGTLLKQGGEVIGVDVGNSPSEGAAAIIKDGEMQAIKRSPLAALGMLAAAAAMVSPPPVFLEAARIATVKPVTCAVCATRRPANVERCECGATNVFAVVE